MDDVELNKMENMSHLIGVENQKNKIIQDGEKYSFLLTSNVSKASHKALTVSESR